MATLNFSHFVSEEVGGAWCFPCLEAILVLLNGSHSCSFMQLRVLCDEIWLFTPQTLFSWIAEKDVYSTYINHERFTRPEKTS